MKRRKQQLQINKKDRHRCLCCEKKNARLLTFLEDWYISGWVHFFKRHLELIEQSQGNTSLLLHDPVYHLGVKLDLKFAQCRLKFAEIVNLCSHILSIRERFTITFYGLLCVKDRCLLGWEFVEVRLLVELVEQLTKKIAVCKVLLKLVDWLYKIRRWYLSLGHDVWNFSYWSFRVNLLDNLPSKVRSLY